MQVILHGSTSRRKYCARIGQKQTDPRYGGLRQPAVASLTFNHRTLQALAAMRGPTSLSSFQVRG